MTVARYMSSHLVKAVTFTRRAGSDSNKRINRPLSRECDSPVHYRKGDHRKAVEDYDIALGLGLSPEDTYRAYIRRGAAHEALDQLDKARQDFDKAIEINPESPFAYLNRGSFHRRKGDHTKAIEDYNMVLGLDFPPESAYQAYLGRGTAYAELGQLDRARQDFERAEAVPR